MVIKLDVSEKAALPIFKNWSFFKTLSYYYIKFESLVTASFKNYCMDFNEIFIRMKLDKQFAILAIFWEDVVKEKKISFFCKTLDWKWVKIMYVSKWNKSKCIFSFKCDMIFNEKKFFFNLKFSFICIKITLLWLNHSILKNLSIFLISVLVKWTRGMKVH